MDTKLTLFGEKDAQFKVIHMPPDGSCLFHSICYSVYGNNLYSDQGFFGKGSLSRGYPSFGLSKKGIPPIIKERQWKRRKSWMESMKNNIANSLLPEGSDKSAPNDSKSRNVQISNDNTDVVIDEVNEDISQDSSSNKSVNDLDLNSDNVKTVVGGDDKVQNVNSSNKVLVLADSDDEDIEKIIRDPQPHLEDEPIKTSVETLNLTVEEAFFLSYALGCLHVIDISGQPLKLKQMWQTFCEVKPDFIESYVSYHYFRAKGWVVKTGNKFGGDFLLYKQGPPFYHASFIVLVEKVNSKLERQKESLTWTKLHGLNRLSEGSGKDVIVCQVVFPDDLTSEDLATPKSLTRFQVNELMIKRWISSQERDDKEVFQE